MSTIKQTIVRPFIILLLCISMLTLVSPAHAAPIKAPASDSILQYTSAGHIFGFAINKVYLAGLDHALTVEFIDGLGLAPLGQSAAAAQTGQPPTLGLVTYQQAWPGISIAYTASPAGLAESTYTLQPGANPVTIRLKYNTPVQLNKNGTLTFTFKNGSISESAPIAWQTIHGKRIAVHVAFQINNQIVGFTLGSYDLQYPLTIDPTLSWNTFLGGAGYDDSRSIAVDNIGNVYVAGFSVAPWGNPPQGFDDLTHDAAFVAKLDSEGTLIWNIFLGENDSVSSIVLDDSGNIYVAGSSYGTWGTPVRSYSGNMDTFAAKLGSGGALIWNTFLGGVESDDAGVIAVDNSGNVYVAGASSATWGIPVDNNSAFSSVSAFAAKLDSSGALTWNTFLGGVGSDIIYSITVDDSRNVYLTGYSNATWGNPVRVYTFNMDGNGDAFAAKLDVGGTLIWNTFLGGALSDGGESIAVDNSRNVYVAGYSHASWGNPVRAFSSVNPDGFVAKMDSDGVLIWNTFLGGAGSDYGSSITIDDGGNAYVVGESDAAWGCTPMACTTLAYNGNYDVFTAKLDFGGALIWNAFLGGVEGNDYLPSIALDQSENIYVAGYSTVAWGNPVRAHSGDYDAFVAKLDSPPAVIINQAASQADPTNASTINFTATFSEPINISTFTNDDLTLGGTAPGALSATISEVAPNDGTTFNIAVSGMSGPGTVTASIEAAKVIDISSGNLNTASTSTDNTVTYAAFCSNVTEIPQIECEALVALYNSTNGPSWRHNSGWLQIKTPCIWFGITCVSGHISGIDLGNNRLTGNIPPEIGNLTSLQDLYLDSNQLTGSIPVTIGNLTSLQYLYLGSNQLTGNIPVEIGNLISLDTLLLYDNQLTGSIPAEIGNLTSLTYLSLFDTQLTGSIPHEIGNLTSITYLFLYRTQLTGHIPNEIGNLISLQNLNLSNNQLTGSIPPEIGGLSSLVHLNLSNNQLMGSIPPEIANLSSLQTILLSNNQLTGSIPDTLTNLISLYMVTLDCTLTSSNPTVITFVSAKSPDWATCPLNLSIEQATSQPDPSSANAINFTLVASRPVNLSTLVNDDLTLGGTAPGTLSAAISQMPPNNGTTFKISVSGMSGPGTVTASIDIAKVSDISGNVNTASTSTDNTVTYTICEADTVPETVPTIPQDKDISGFLCTADDIDVYKFEVSAPFTTIVAKLIPPPSGDFALYLVKGWDGFDQWWDSGRPRIIMNTGVGGNSPPDDPIADRSIELRFNVLNDLASGTDYYLVVESPPDGSYSANPYTLNLKLVLPNVSLPNPDDSDGDGLLNSWETDGLKIDGAVVLDLPAMGADPNHKDIFVQLDYMEDATHSQKPKPEAIEKIVQAFANAPVSNPDYSTGIHLHVDYGPESEMTPGASWGDLSESKSIAYVESFGSGWVDHWKNNHYSWEDFDTIKRDNLSVARARVFHYGIFVHKLGGFGDSSGISRGLGASDFIVSLGAWSEGVGSVNEQAGTFMHELGHNLGLRHGGNDHIQYKPNFLSVMNYSFQTNGLLYKESEGYFDYSRFTLPDLNELKLNEMIGLDGDTSVGSYGTRYYCGSTNTLVYYANNPLDWNCNGDPNDADIQVDVNHDHHLTTLVSYNEWPSLFYTGGSIGASGVLTERLWQTPFDEITQAEAALIPSFTPKILSITRADINPSAAASVDFTVTFSEPVNGLATDDFALAKTGGINGEFVANVSGGPTVYTVSVNTGTGSGNLSLIVPASATVTNLAGHLLSDLPYTSTQPYTINKTISTSTPTQTPTPSDTPTTTPTATETVTVTPTITPTVTATATITPTLIAVTFTSIAAQDGWVLESGETTNVGGTINSTATTFNLGDDAAKKQYRGILSFNTSSVPDNATITGVTLKVKQQAIVGGGNPVTIFQGFMIDMKNGFFGTAPLQPADFQASASKSFGPFLPASANGWYSINLTSGQANINKLANSSGLTQIRLRFKLDDNNNAVANYLSLYSGNAPVASRPQLVITYSLP